MYAVNFTLGDTCEWLPKEWVLSYIVGTSNNQGLIDVSVLKQVRNLLLWVEFGTVKGYSHFSEQFWHNVDVEFPVNQT